MKNIRPTGIADLATRLTTDYPQFTFTRANRARYVATEHKIYYCDNIGELLHELGHALLNHKNFVQDIELLQMERAAWDQAEQLARRYHVKIDRDEIEDAMDSYRDWLHRRSLCPKCGQTGLQSRDSLEYRCLNCSTHWTANDARSCELRRRRIR